jgi:hypothetical protein
MKEKFLNKKIVHQQRTHESTVSMSDRMKKFQKAENWKQRTAIMHERPDNSIKSKDANNTIWGGSKKPRGNPSSNYAKILCPMMSSKTTILNNLPKLENYKNIAVMSYTKKINEEPSQQGDSEYYYCQPGNSNFNSNVSYKFGTGLDGKLDELNIRMADSMVGSENYLPDLPSNENLSIGIKSPTNGLKKCLSRREKDYNGVNFYVVNNFRTRILWMLQEDLIVGQREFLPKE